MASQEPLLGSSVHDAAQRAADLIDVLVPRPGRRDEAAAAGPPDQRARLTAVLRAHGEAGPIEISAADLAGLRQAALDLRRRLRGQRRRAPPRSGSTACSRGARTRPG